MAPLLLRPFVVGILFCAATTVVFLSTRNGAPRDPDRTGNDATGSHVTTRSTTAAARPPRSTASSEPLNRTDPDPDPGIEAASRTCGPADDRTEAADTDRAICRALLTMPPTSPVAERLAAARCMTSADLVRLATTDCGCLRRRRGYYTPADTTPAERAFPLAFSLLAYENLRQTERLLRLVYRPHNAYCIHVDRKAGAAMHAGVEALAACLPNVVIGQSLISAMSIGTGDLGFGISRA